MVDSSNIWVFLEGENTELVSVDVNFEAKNLDKDESLKKNLEAEAETSFEAADKKYEKKIAEEEKLKKMFQKENDLLKCEIKKTRDEAEGFRIALSNSKDQYKLSQLKIRNLQEQIENLKALNALNLNFESNSDFVNKSWQWINPK